MTRWLLIVFVLLCAAGASLACPVRARRAVVVNRNVVVARKVVAVETAAVAVFAPVALAVPAYGAAYVPAAAPAPAAGVNAEVVAALKAIAARLEALEKGTTAPPMKSAEDAPGTPAPAPAADVLPLFRSKCASCHEARVSGTKGGKFTLLSGAALAPLTDRQLRRIGSQTYTGAMPRGGKLTDEEVARIQEWLDSK